MDKRIKYSLKQKLAVVKAVTSGRESRTSAARRIGTSLSTVQRWVNLYRQHGAASLERKSRYYSGQFKIMVVSYVLKNQLSLMRTAALFGIPQDHTIALWLKIYKGQGAAGLLKETRGRNRSTMAKRSKKDNKKPATTADERLAALQKENEYLRAENAFLKKLDALIQEEKTQAQGWQPKPSKN